MPRRSTATRRYKPFARKYLLLGPPYEWNRVSSTRVTGELRRALGVANTMRVDPHRRTWIQRGQSDSR